MGLKILSAVGRWWSFPGTLPVTVAMAHSPHVGRLCDLGHVPVPRITGPQLPQLFWTFHRNGIIHHMVFSGRLLSHSLGIWPKAKHVPFSRGGNQGTVMSKNCSQSPAAPSEPLFWTEGPSGSVPPLERDRGMDFTDLFSVPKTCLKVCISWAEGLPSTSSLMRKP